MGRRSIRKGKAWEREVARRLSAATGLEFARVLTETRGGNQGDVRAPESPLVAQCKVGARPSVWKAVEEAQEAAGDGEVPVAVVKRNGAGSRPAEELAVLPLETFLELVARLS